MKKGWYWPWFIGVLLVATAGGQGVMLYAATHDSTFALEPDYYKRAVAFDTQSTGVECREQRIHCRLRQ